MPQRRRSRAPPPAACRYRGRRGRRWPAAAPAGDGGQQLGAPPTAARHPDIAQAPTAGGRPAAARPVGACPRRCRRSRRRPPAAAPADAAAAGGGRRAAIRRPTTRPPTSSSSPASTSRPRRRSASSSPPIRATSSARRDLLARPEPVLARHVPRGGASSSSTATRPIRRAQRAADTLLLLGKSLAGIPEREAACQTFAAALKQYPEHVECAAPARHHRTSQCGMLRRRTDPLGDAELDGLFAAFADAPPDRARGFGRRRFAGAAGCGGRWRERRRGSPRSSCSPSTIACAAARGARPRTWWRRPRRADCAARILVRAGRAPTADIEAAARAARYRLLHRRGARRGRQPSPHRPPSRRSGRDVSHAPRSAAPASSASPPCGRGRCRRRSCSRGRSSTCRAPALPRPAPRPASTPVDRRHEQRPALRPGASRAAHAAACWRRRVSTRPRLAATARRLADAADAIDARGERAHRRRGDGRRSRRRAARCRAVRGGAGGGARARAGAAAAGGRRRRLSAALRAAGGAGRGDGGGQPAAASSGRSPAASSSGATAVSPSIARLGRDGAAGVALKPGRDRRLGPPLPGDVPAATLPAGSTVAALGEDGRRAIGAGRGRRRAARLPRCRPSGGAGASSRCRRSAISPMPPRVWTSRSARFVGERLAEPPLFPDFSGRIVICRTVHSAAIPARY